MKRVGIYGLGRIGRLVLRHYLTKPSDSIDIIIVNDTTPVDDLAYLMNFDSVHRKPSFHVQSKSDMLEIGMKQAGYAKKLLELAEYISNVKEE
jgi:glyceraldehyde-3-phosphate dehydrogenase/erythrose-4-phosphate dehydrogenase